MTYPDVIPAMFQHRPNRFIAEVLIDGAVHIAHVKNTGRCRELLIPGAKVWLSESANPGRKTAYDLIAVQKEQRLINMDSQAPNKVFAEWAKSGQFISGLTLLRPECRYGDSRFDFYWEAKGRRGFVEVKGVTLEEDGVARFPDAPTERGIKHIRELISCQREGYEAAIFFVIQMTGLLRFEPNDRTHQAFGTALREANAAGVSILAYDCLVAPDSLVLNNPVPVHLTDDPNGQ